LEAPVAFSYQYIIAPAKISAPATKAMAIVMNQTSKRSILFRQDSAKAWPNQRMKIDFLLRRVDDFACFAGTGIIASCERL